VKLHDVIGLSSWLALLAYAVTGLLFIRRIRRRLASHHPKQLAELGPLFVWNPIQAWFHQLEWRRFVVSGNYRRLNDPELDRLCRPARLLLGAGLYLIAGVGAAFVVVAALVARSA
jgi:hypothetical protein